MCEIHGTLIEFWKRYLPQPTSPFLAGTRGHISCIWSLCLQLEAYVGIQLALCCVVLVRILQTVYVISLIWKEEG